MTYRDIAPDQAGEIVGQMQHRIVLNVRVVANGDPVNVATDHRIIPDAGVFSDSHIAENDCPRRLRSVPTGRRMAPIDIQGKTGKISDFKYVL